MAAQPGERWFSALVIEGLHDAGVEVVLDGVGDSYSVFPALRSLPIDAVRVHAGTTARIYHDDGRSMVAALVAIGRVLGFRVIADGVGDETQAGTLAGLGCHVGQGPLWPETHAPLLVI